MILGVRCSNKEFSYAVVEGSKNSPTVVSSGTISFPKNFIRGREHRWFLQEIENLIAKNSINMIVLKRFEGKFKGGNSYEKRVELEGIVFLAGGNHDIPVFKKMNITIAKEIFGKGKADYLKTKLDASKIESYDDYKKYEQEAILCGWSEL